MSEKIAIISGVSGQDGSYMAELLLEKNYKVVGLTRKKSSTSPENISSILGKIQLVQTDYSLGDLKEIFKNTHPSEVYNFTGQSYVGKSWDKLEETYYGSGILVGNLLEAIVQTNRNCRFLQASTAEIYDATGTGPISENTPLNPLTPYACAKAFAQNLVNAYRNNYDLFATSAVLFPHESPRRAEDFLSKKVTRAALLIKLKKENVLNIGNLFVERDWGYAPDYVSGCYDLLQLSSPHTVNFCTGVKRKVVDMVSEIFQLLDLDYKKYISVETNFVRSKESSSIFGSNEKAKTLLNWAPKVQFKDMLKILINAEIKKKNYDVELV